MIQSYIKKLKECLTIEDVESLMSERIFEKSNNSKFEDDYILLPNQVGTYTNKDIRFKSKLYEILFKIFLFLKLDDQAGPKLLGSGTSRYAEILRTFLIDMEIEQPNIKHFGDITFSTIEAISMKYLNDTSVKYTTHRNKIRKLEDWVKYVNHNLPNFLRLRADIVLEAPSFHKLNKLAEDEKKKDEKSPSRRKPYDLSELKKIMNYSIKYIEKYSEEGLIAGDIFIKSRRKHDKDKQRYIYAFNELGNHILSFSEPTLKNIQEEIRQDSNMFIKKYGATNSPRVSKIFSSLINVNKKLEASCLVVILMTTGMRNSELVRLQRFPKIINDEYFHLKKMVFKTSQTNEGKEYSIPIPKITKTAIEVLSKLGEIKDGKKNGNIMSRSLQIIAGNTEEADLRGAIVNLIKFLCRFTNVKKTPTPHDFRHAIAFLVSRLNQKDGYELARLLLGHKSLTMTLRYLGHYNLYINNALSELYEEESTFLLENIEENYRNGKKVYGEKAELFTNGYTFKGSFAEEFVDLMNKNILNLIKQGKLAIIQTPICLCLHDLAKPEEIACQRGFNLENMINVNPLPSMCKPERCGNAIFTESNIETLMKDIKDIPQELVDRLQNNKFFVENGGFNNDPYIKIIKKYKQDKGVI